MKFLSNYNFRDSDYKEFKKTLWFYSFLIIVNSGLTYLFPMGPCADIPSTIVMLIVFGTMLTSIILFVKTLIKTIKKDKRYILPLLVHIIFWFGLIILSIVSL